MSVFIELLNEILVEIINTLKFGWSYNNLFIFTQILWVLPVPQCDLINVFFNLNYTSIYF